MIKKEGDFSNGVRNHHTNELMQKGTIDLSIEVLEYS